VKIREEARRVEPERSLLVWNGRVELVADASTSAARADPISEVQEVRPRLKFDPLAPSDNEKGTH
jgi:hypothetical protein